MGIEYQRVLSLIPAEPGWRVVRSDHVGIGHHCKVADLDPATFSNEKLFGIEPVVAWALVEGEADGMPYQEVEPAYRYGGGIDASIGVRGYGYEDTANVKALLAPGEEPNVEELRDEAIYWATGDLRRRNGLPFDPEDEPAEPTGSRGPGVP